MQCQLQPSMDTYRAPPPKAQPDHADDDSDELGVFAAERYFYGGDDALWPWPCERSSSSLSSAFRTGTHEHDRSVPTAVTSSSEASWNSRSALLPNEPAVAVAAAAPIIEPRRSDAEGQRAGNGRPASSSNNLRRWLLGAAACACAGGASSEESVSAADDDEMETTSERFPGTEIPEATATAARSSVTRASGRLLLEGDDKILAGMDGHRRATNLGELSTPILHPQAAAAATSDSDERRRRNKSLEMFRPVPVCDGRSALGAATQSSAFTIIAGNTAVGGDGDARRASSGGGGGGSSGHAEDDDAAPSELGCAYPPSEASVVWSVVTADGAASAGNFSSAASGYYYHYCFNDVDDDGAMRRAAVGRNTHRRRSGIIPSGSSLLMCMSDKAVDAVGPAPSSVHGGRQEVGPAAVATLGASGGSRNGHGHGEVYKPGQDVIRRR